MYVEVCSVLVTETQSERNSRNCVKTLFSSETWLHWRECRASLFEPDASAARVEVSTSPRRLSSNLLVTFHLTCMETKHPNNGVELIFQSLSSNHIDILHLNRM